MKIETGGGARDDARADNEVAERFVSFAIGSVSSEHRLERRYDRIAINVARVEL